MSNLSKVKPVTFHHDGGQKQAHFFVDTFGQVQGEFKTWYESGQIMSKTYFENGEKNGTEEMFYENGSPAMLRTWARGKLCGQERSWNKLGKVVHETWN